MKLSTLGGLTPTQLQQVSGGVNPVIAWAIGDVISRGVSAYADWVSNGAGGWREDYNGSDYDDPLL